MDVQKEPNCVNQKLNIVVKRITNPYGHPNILAEFIAGQLKNRVLSARFSNRLTHNNTYSFPQFDQVAMSRTFAIT